jgi:hypothetical protein
MNVRLNLQNFRSFSIKLILILYILGLSKVEALQSRVFSIYVSLINSDANCKANFYGSELFF